MKKLLLASLLSLSALSAMAQMSGRIDGRIDGRFGQNDQQDNIVLRPGQSVQLMTIDNRIVTISADASLGCNDGRTPGYPGSGGGIPGGGYNDGRGGRGRHDGGMNRRDDLERLSDQELVDRARFGGIGQCRIEEGTRYSHCSLYVKVLDRGYPNGTGCARDTYEAAQSLRQAIRSGICL